MLLPAAFAAPPTTRHTKKQCQSIQITKPHAATAALFFDDMHVRLDSHPARNSSQPYCLPCQRSFNQCRFLVNGKSSILSRSLLVVPLKCAKRCFLISEFKNTMAWAASHGELIIRFNEPFHFVSHSVVNFICQRTQNRGIHMEVVQQLDTSIAVGLPMIDIDSYLS